MNKLYFGVIEHGGFDKLKVIKTDGFGAHIKEKPHCLHLYSYTQARKYFNSLYEDIGRYKRDYEKSFGVRYKFHSHLYTFSANIDEIKGMLHDRTISYDVDEPDIDDETYYRKYGIYTYYGVIPPFCVSVVDFDLNTNKFKTLKRLSEYDDFPMDIPSCFIRNY